MKDSWWYHEGNRAMRMGDWKIVAANEEEWLKILSDFKGVAPELVDP